ncbi:MAG: DNA-deoxyinosine glycosylase [Treponemataceae bacterium]|nr:DNA-deoxyinosine glycosylase [Treponemataceae bacterium]
MSEKNAASAAPSETKTVSHPIPPVWNAQSRVLLLGTMPSPKSREVGFFYMHPQNRFWSVLPSVFGETLSLPNNAPDSFAAINERRDFLLRHNIALWDVLASCQIDGAADSSIKNAVPNDFSLLFESSQIHHVFCTGKTAFSLWQKHCAALYEKRYNLVVCCLPSTSPANASWNTTRLLEAYRAILTSV